MSLKRMDIVPKAAICRPGQRVIFALSNTRAKDSSVNAEGLNIF